VYGRREGTGQQEFAWARGRPGVGLDGPYSHEPMTFFCGEINLWFSFTTRKDFIRPVSMMSLFLKLPYHME